MLAMRAHRADDRLGIQDGQSTICVWVTSATSAPSSVRMRVCQTDSLLPTFTGVASPTSTDPTGPAPRKLVLLSTVVVPLAPSRSEEHTSELQSLMRISYAVFCLKKKQKTK